MEDDVLLANAMENITTTQMKREYDMLFESLKETSEEISKIKGMEKEYIDIRNHIIKRLYHEHKASMIQIANVCGITRQMVHYICTEDKKEVTDAEV